jgi:hypothetical protein
MILIQPANWPPPSRAMTDPDPSASGRVLFEFIQAGGQMRIAAIDEATGIEVVVIAPLSATQRQMEQLAMAKLRRRLQQADLPRS